MTREEKIKELLQDEEAIKTIFVEDANQTLANLAANGVEMSLEELGELSSGILSGMGADEGELSEDALENVAGGGPETFIGIVIGYFTKDIYTAYKGGKTAGRKDKKNKSTKGMAYVEEANSAVGKGWRAIGYTIGYYL